MGRVSLRALAAELLVTDVVMPRMLGKEVDERIREFKPHVEQVPCRRADRPAHQADSTNLRHPATAGSRDQKRTVDTVHHTRQARSGERAVRDVAVERRQGMERADPT